MSINEYLNTPADLYHMALECGYAWDEGIKDARATIEKANAIKAEAHQGQPKRRQR